MNDLVEFLRARLDEDEALAREAPPGPWHIGNAVDPTQPCHVHTFPGARVVADGLNWLVAEHIAHQHPARVLSEVMAKRKILESVVPSVADMAESIAFEYGARHSPPGRVAVELLCLLALPYASHPDYREEWKP
ncbi:DUF6221 family protein [Streptomyces sp. NRRL S-1022]|uniref:DUF6221 family protein n=1 Tax=Streptomyces sp. NRRL S-1022 TaxID=1463880 RepID=UPI00068B2FCC|nr:DUF6221 family protein [Streptomyces sp. NRRL S-1022]